MTSNSAILLPKDLLKSPSKILDSLPSLTNLFAYSQIYKHPNTNWSSNLLRSIKLLVQMTLTFIPVGEKAVEWGSELRKTKVRTLLEIMLVTKYWEESILAWVARTKLLRSWSIHSRTTPRLIMNVMRTNLEGMSIWELKRGRDVRNGRPWLLNTNAPSTSQLKD